MRRSILLVLVAALMLTVTVGASASVAAGPSAEAQAAARRGRRAARCPTGTRAARGRRASSCRARRRAASGGTLGDGQYSDPRTGVRLKVGGGEAEVGIPGGSGSCPGTGALVTARGALSRAGGTARASGVVQPVSGVTITWALTVRSPALSYALDVDYVLQLPGLAPCQDRQRHTGVLSKL